MFDKFGEFDSAEELNMCAAGLLAEGDIESLQQLATENGIDKEDVQDYIDGYVDELATPLMAALGKIEVESRELKPKEIMEDWVEYIRAQCMESEKMEVAVRKKGKSVKGCIAELLKWSFKNQIPVDKDILKAAKVSDNKVTLGIPGMGTAKKIMVDYYMGGMQG